MKTILVPVDFSNVTPGVLVAVKELAASFAGCVELLHVAARGEGTGTPAIMPAAALKMPEEIAGPLCRRLEAIKQSFAGRIPGEVKTVLIEGGAVVDNILAECEGIHADIIVMGSHCHGALYSLLAGSVTAAVIKSAKCPVLVVPNSQQATLSEAA